MPTEKVSDFPSDSGCKSSDHDPKWSEALGHGVYVHTCPLCGATRRFFTGELRNITRLGPNGMDTFHVGPGYTCSKSLGY